MVTIRKVGPEDFEEIYGSLLLQFRNPELSREDYRRLFIRQWDGAEDWHGYAMVDQGVIVGFLGMIFSIRTVRGVQRRFCNLSHWIVQPPYRGLQGLALLYQAFKEPDCVLTTFTPTPFVTGLYERLRWPELDHRCHIILALPRLRKARAALVFEPDRIQDRLDGEEARFFRDHRPYRCGHLYIEEPGTGCYVVYTRVRRRRLPFVLIHHLGDPEVFVRNAGLVRSALCCRERALGLLVDERFLKGRRVPGTYVFRGEKRFFRDNRDEALGPRVTREEVDSLYSEYIVTKV